MNARSRIAVAPHPERNEWLTQAVTRGGGQVVSPNEAAGLIWTIPKHPERLRTILDEYPNIAWVQLPFAGVESFMHLTKDDRTWTCGKGVYAEPVAELALTLMLTGMRGVGTYARRRTWEKSDANALGKNLIGARVTILGGGGITNSLLKLLSGFDVSATVIRRQHDVPVPGADRTWGTDRLHDALGGSDVVVLALAMTDATRGIINADALRNMPSHAWLINVARGPHVVTDDLVCALRERRIGGAGLDVTDPEPLPDDHPLWTLPNAIITPHVGNTPDMAIPLLGARVTENVRRFIDGETLVGLIDADVGY